jgi:hypothetical protein
MKSIRAVQIAALTVILLAGAGLASPATAQENLLTNAGFESGSLDGWQTWAITTPGTSAEVCNDLSTPSFLASSDAAHSGSYAARLFNQWTTHNAGLYQVVANVTPGATYRFTIWGRASSLNEGETTSNSVIRLRVGIDPNGGGDPTAASVVWSGDATPMDAYAQLSIQATAAGNQITVFTRSRPDWCLFRNDVYWDDASLTLVGAADTTQAPQQPTQAGAPTQAEGLATPDASGRIVHTVVVGDTLSGIAFRYGVSADEIRRLNNLTSDVVILGSQLVISTGGQAPPPPPPATQEVAPPPTEEPTEEAAELPTATEPPPAVAEVPEEPAEAAGPGTICVMGFDDANANGIRDAEEPMLAGITFVLEDGAEMVGRYTTDGVSEPYCFTELAPGSYAISWVGDNFRATTDQTWAINVEAGAILNREFGAQALDAAADEASGRAGNLPPWLVSLSAALGVVLVLGVIGGAGYFVLMRSQRI